jgi:transcriptional regulator with XRE-family HTH domain
VRRHDALVNDLAIGRVFRHLRHRLGWRQEDVSKRAGLSIGLCSLIERGHLDGVTLGKLRKVAGILEIELAIEVRWRGGSLDRSLASRHAAMSEAVARLLLDAGWEVRPEVSFSHFGERGVVDLVAWHPGERALLLIELKTELVDVNALLGVTDRRRRLADVIAQSCGWAPGLVGQWVVVAEGRTNRRRLAEFRTILRAAFPFDGRSIPGWLANPSTAASAIWFLPDSNLARARSGRAPRQRVRLARPRVEPVVEAARSRPRRGLASSSEPNET